MPKLKSAPKSSQVIKSSKKASTPSFTKLQMKRSKQGEAKRPSYTKTQINRSK